MKPPVLIAMPSQGKLASGLKGPGAAGFTLVEIMIVVAIIALLAAISVPNFLRARKRAQAAAILEDVRLIDSAKEQYAIENGKLGNVVPKVADLRPYLKKGSRMSTTAPLSHFRDILGNIIFMNDLNNFPVIDDVTRDNFSDVIPDAHAFWGSFCN